MKLKKIISLILGSTTILLGIGVSSAKAALLVTPTGDANVLISTILGSGITASNLSYTGSPNASGTFTGGLSTGIGIDEGIILTSGVAALASSNGYTTNPPSQTNGTPGDFDLSALAGGIATNDASILNFDFTSSSSNIFFNFVFASAEYPTFVNSSFNDTFGFFVDGKNIALIPETTTPVTINNINAGKNQALFNDNTSSKFQLPYGGFTNVFTASALGLLPGTHNIKIGITDTLDTRFDSAVFIQANTFSITNPTSVPEPFTIIGTLIGGTTALVMKKKLKAIAAL